MKSIFTTLFIILSFALFAQQSVQQSMYMLNPYQYNEAFAGTENSLIVTADIRKQWTNLEGSPGSQNLTAHLPLYFLKGGLGFQFENDELGATRNTSFKASYNYIHSISEQFSISIGASAGIIQQSYDGSILRTSDGDYEPGAFNHNDLLLSTLSQNAIAPTFGAAVLLQLADLDVGLSANNLTESNFEFQTDDLATTFQQQRHFTVHAGYEIDLGDFISLRPTVLLRSDLAENQIDLNLLAKLDEKFLLGGGIRGIQGPENDAAVIIVGIELNEHFTLAYSYDIGLSSLNSIQNGSHEFLVKYDLNKKLGGGYPPSIKYNPRFL